MMPQIKRPAHMALAQLLQPWADECADCTLSGDWACPSGLTFRMNRMFLANLRVVYGWFTDAPSDSAPYDGSHSNLK